MRRWTQISDLGLIIITRHEARVLVLHLSCDVTKKQPHHWHRVASSLARSKSSDVDWELSLTSRSKHRNGVSECTANRLAGLLSLTDATSGWFWCCGRCSIFGLSTCNQPTNPEGEVTLLTDLKNHNCKLVTFSDLKNHNYKLVTFSSRYGNHTKVSLLFVKNNLMF